MDYTELNNILTATAVENTQEEYISEEDLGIFCASPCTVDNMGRDRSHSDFDSGREDHSAEYDDETYEDEDEDEDEPPYTYEDFTETISYFEDLMHDLDGAAASIADDLPYFSTSSEDIYNQVDSEFCNILSKMRSLLVDLENFSRDNL